MNIIEAVPRMKDGEIMQTDDPNSVNLLVRIEGRRLQFNSTRNGPEIGWQCITDHSLWLFTSEFVPYKPKSVIEEAIEDIARAFNETTTTMHPAQYGMVSKFLTRLANSMKVKQ